MLSERSVRTHAFGIARQLDLARALGVLPRAVRLLAVTVDLPGLGSPASLRSWHGFLPPRWRR